MFNRIKLWLASLFHDETFDAFRPMIICHMTDGLGLPQRMKCRIMKDSDYIGYKPFEREIRFTEM